MDRQQYLDKKPLAEVDVQSLKSPQVESYPDLNGRLMFQAKTEDPLSFYARTQDGEWQIPPQVNCDDPWVRLLILSPVKPTIVDLAIEIHQQPYRAAREQWIDKLLAKAKATFPVRSEAAPAEVVEAKEIAKEATTSKEKTDVPTNVDEEIPMVAIQSRQTDTLFKRLINYLAADLSTAQREVSREELRWLLAEWTGGPALLTLSPALAWRRADTAPLWHALDRNNDQVLSREEIQQTMTMFKQADRNHDDIVDLAELEQFGKDRVPRKRVQGHPLVVVLDENTDWKTLKEHLHNVYEKPVEVSSLLSLPADMMVRVSFANAKAKVALLATKDGTDPSWRLQSSSGYVITVVRQETYLELSAAQGIAINPADTHSDMKQTQIAIGAVVDGRPLFRLLDHDNNQKLTPREQRGTRDFLIALDQNQDGQLKAKEMPTAIRLAVTHGPKVHQHLAQAVAAQREHSASPALQAPVWFVGMDRNHDGDLSQREFQGNPVQFAKFDRNGDGLISRAEVQETETQKTETQ